MITFLLNNAVVLVQKPHKFLMNDYQGILFEKLGRRRFAPSTLGFLTVQAPVVRRLDNAICWINLNPVDSVVCFSIIYPLDSDLSVG